MSRTLDEIAARAKALQESREKDVEFETSWGQVKCHDESHVWFPRFFGESLADQAKTRPFVTLSNLARQNETAYLMAALEMLIERVKLAEDGLKIIEHGPSHAYLEPCMAYATRALAAARKLEADFKERWK